MAKARLAAEQQRKQAAEELSIAGAGISTLDGGNELANGYEEEKKPSEKNPWDYQIDRERGRKRVGFADERDSAINADIEGVMVGNEEDLN
jgi:hypothetical protein